MPTAISQSDELLELWPDMETAARLQAFHALPRAVADAFFLGLEPHYRHELVHSLPNGERRMWLRLLPPDDAADLIQLASKEEQPQLLIQLDDVARREVNALLAYKEDVAGGLMSP